MVRVSDSWELYRVGIFCEYWRWRRFYLWTCDDVDDAFLTHRDRKRQSQCLIHLHRADKLIGLTLKTGSGNCRLEMHCGVPQRNFSAFSMSVSRKKFSLSKLVTFSINKRLIVRQKTRPEWKTFTCVEDSLSWLKLERVKESRDKKTMQMLSQLRLKLDMNRLTEIDYRWWLIKLFECERHKMRYFFLRFLNEVTWQQKNVLSIRQIRSMNFASLWTVISDLAQGWWPRISNVCPECRKTRTKRAKKDDRRNYYQFK